MNLPILILGYERSGTTLLRRLVSMHPSIPFDIVHEQSQKLFKSISREDAIRKLTYPSKQAGVLTGGISSLRVGQKIPYTNFKIVKKSIEKFDLFFDDFYIIHIIRDPIGAINSQVKTFKKNTNKCISQYFNSVPKTIIHLRKFKNVLTVNFEDLLNNPKEQIESIYNWMGDFEEDNEFLNRVISTREPWKYKKKAMAGLRYFDSIQFINKKPVIKKEDMKIINKKKIAIKW